MKLYKSSRTTISARNPEGAIEVWEKESGEKYEGSVDDWQLVTGDIAFAFNKDEAVPIPNTATVKDMGLGRFSAVDDAGNWAEFWPNRTVSFESG